MPRELNERQKLFALKMVECDFHQTNAAIAAGYSKKTAYSIANKLLKKDEIQKLLGEIIEEKLNLQKGQLKYKVLNELNEIAFADVTNDINVITETVTEDVRDNEGNIIDSKERDIQRVEIIDTKKSKQSRAIASIKQDSKGAIEIKYHDKEKALEMIGKFGGLFVDKVDISGKLETENKTVNVNYDDITEEEAKELFKNAMLKDE